MRLLSDNQKAAIEKLRHLKVGALFMGCGTGKTQTAVMLINSVDNIDSVLWVCPCRTIENLKTELSQCDLKYPVEIVGVESIGQSDRIYVETLAKVNAKVFLVVDESLKIKNIKAKRTKRLLTMGERAEYKLILNGTPITKNILDIYPQMEFLSPKILNMPYRVFKYQYCVVKEKRRGGKVIKSWVTGYANVDHLLSIIEPYVYECSLDLNLKKSYREFNWSMTRNERYYYEDLKEFLLSQLEEADDFKILGVFQRLQHFYSLCSDKFKAIDGLVNDKTIIFCRFIKTAETLKNLYPQALVLTYGKSSFGLNLQNYNRTIYFDKTWDYAFREQSEARTYRTGQQNDCEYIDLTGDVGLEKLFDDCISKKLSLIEAFKLRGNDLKCL